MNNSDLTYDAVINSPIGKIGINLTDDAISELSFLADNVGLTSHTPDLSNEFSTYFQNPQHQFNLTINASGTAFQKRVWHELCNIPSGQTLTYGELAKKLDSSPRAVGQACRKNPTPIIVPCHRVISATGLGGYAGDTTGKLFAITEWLLTHEKQN